MERGRMTKTALANKELAEKAASRYSKESIAQKDRASRESIADKDRKSSEKMGHWKNFASVAGSTIGAAGKLGSALINDPSWYKKYPVDLDKFLNVPSYQRLGSTVYQFNTQNSAYRPLTGIAIARWYPTVGPQKVDDNFDLTEIVTNPINAILQRSKEQVLKLNSRSSVNWEAGDLGYNLIASAQIYAMLQDVKRALCASLTYSGVNAYLGDTLLNALGFTASDVRSNSADIKAQLELTIARFNHSIVVPSSLSLVARWAYLNTVILRDRSDESAQLMAYRQEMAYVLSDDGSKLEGVVLSNYRINVLKYLTFINTAITRITDNADFVEMYADLRAAFGQDILQCASLPMDATLTFGDDVLNRNQWHNIVTTPQVNFSVAGNSSIQPSNDIQQDTSGYLYQSGGSTSTGNSPMLLVYDAGVSTVENVLTQIDSFYNVESRRLINGYDYSIDGDFMLDATRFQIFGKLSSYVDTSHMAFYVTDCGTEVVTGIDMYMKLVSPDTSGATGNSCTLCTFTGLTVAQLSTKVSTINGVVPILRQLTSNSQVDWNPLMYIYIVDGSNVAKNMCVPVGDLAACFEIAGTTLSNINLACTLSEFYLDSSTFNGRGR